MNIRTVMAGTLVLAFSGIGEAAGDTANETIGTSLTHRSYRTWTVDLPNEQWFKVSGGIGIPHQTGESFIVSLQGHDLNIDTDGDGAPDRIVRAKADDYGVRRARVVLNGNDADGRDFKYAVRLRDEGAGWMWAPGGAMVGVIETDAGPVKVQVIDRNGNGTFNDIGVDAMVVGRSKVATYLSRTAVVSDRLWNVDVRSNGSSISLKPFEGDTTKFDMTSDFTTRARLMSAVVRSTDGQHSFDLGRFEGAVEVPVGAYEIIGGRIGLGEQTVRVAPGRAKAIVATSGETTRFHWGGPIAGEFDYGRQGDQVMFDPNRIWFYGSAGEQYVDWNPIGKSPEFEIRNASTGEVLEVLILPGSC